MFRIRTVVLAVAFLFQFSGSSPAVSGPLPVRALAGVADTRLNEMLPMRDGTKLWTSVHLPNGEGAGDSGRRVPTILVRTPYTLEFESAHVGRGMLEVFAKAGYAVVLQNERGAVWSEGDFRIIGNSAEDGYDTVDWIAKQPWSNGRVGAFGCSSSGDSQVKLASIGHPALKTALTISSGSSVGVLGPFHEQGAFYRGGVPQVPWWTWYASLGLRDYPKFPEGISPHNRDWLARSLRDWSPRGDDFALDLEKLIHHLPSMDAVRAVGGQETEFDKFIRRQPGDPAWTEESFLNEGDPWNTPTLWVFQAYDIGLSPNVAAFEYARRAAASQQVRDNQFMLVSGMYHCSFNEESEETVIGERAIGDARYDYDKLFVAWYDHWLKGKGASGKTFDQPRAEVYMAGADRWRRYAQWPPSGAKAVRFHLSSDGNANSRFGNGRLKAVPQATGGEDHFVADPRTPVPSVGGDVCCVGGAYQPGSFDQSALELRQDVLVYTSDPLKDPLEVVGFAEVILHVSSDAPDTDIAVKLVDVYPDGRAFNIGDGIQRMRWRTGYDAPRFMSPGEVYKVRVGPFFIANRFGAGHRLRLDITGSNFPRYERNLNTGGNNFDESVGRMAINSVHVGGPYDSYLDIKSVPTPD